VNLKAALWVVAAVVGGVLIGGAIGRGEGGFIAGGLIGGIFFLIIYPRRQGPPR